VWIPLTWRRSNMVFSSYFMGLFCLFIVEFSLWNNFGNYFWFVFIGFTLLDLFIGDIVSYQLKEILLEAPVGTGLGIVMGITGLGANNFVDFLLSNFVDLGLIMLFRVYIDPALGDILSAIGNISGVTTKKSCTSMFVTFLGCPQVHHVQGSVYQPDAHMAGCEACSQAGRQGRRQPGEVRIVGEGGETVEPILNSFGGYSTDNLSTFYFPYIISLLMVFRDEVGLPSLYGIKEQDMEYYLWFSLIIIFFQLCVDIFIHGVLELFHGWKIYDYLVYTRYRFLQRETRWKGLEDSLDECIDESMRTLDQMCFSSQYYMMMTIHVNGIVYFVLGVQMMIRKKYNMWGDPLLLLVVPFVVGIAYLTGRLLLWIALKVNMWKIKHENTAWHSNVEEDDFDIPDMDDLKGASHDAYLMNQRITSETFRFKFLNYNRSWLINQLPSILTPRTLKRSRPYLINQFARILNQLNRDVSSDSEDEAPDFGPIALTAPSRKIIRWWLAKARKQVKLRATVQPLIFKARGTHCEQCLSKKQLQVHLVFDLEDLANRFTEEHPVEVFDQVAWKRFWMQHQRYETICLKCISLKKDQDRSKTIQGNMAESDEEDGPEIYSDWGPVYLNAVSRAILMQWYRQAQENVWGKSGRKRPQVAVDVSDDEEDENPADWVTAQVRLSEASHALAIRWLRTARARLQQRSGQIKDTGKSERNRRQNFR
ncbi:unnamed protein product, partial [Discosporangium mesarthrocarpum]